MRILYSTTYCTLSGANRSLLGLIDEELCLGNDVLVVSPQEDSLPFVYNELLKRDVVQGRIKYTTYAFGPAIIGYRTRIKRAIWGILAELQILVFMIKNRPDVFHINTLSSTNGYYAAKVLNIPIVWHAREFVEEDYGYVFYSRDRLFKMLRCSNCVIAISKSIKEAFEKKAGCNNIKLIYNGINKSVYISNKKMLFANDNIRIGIVGRIIPAKGQLDAVKALYELKNRGYDNLNMYIYGGEPEPDYYQSIQTYISNNELKAELVGVCDDMPCEYNKMDILLVCSKNEPFGRVTIEGMMTKCLVIGANTSGTAELIIDGVNGLLYRQGDSIHLADKIEYALNNKGIMKNIICYAESWAKEKFDSAINALRINDVYKSVLDE